MSVEYSVVWRIDVDAETPEKAAALALEIQQDPNSTARFFELRNPEGKNFGVWIDPEPTDSPPESKGPPITVTIKPNGDIEIDGAGPDVRIVDERTT